MTDAPKPVRDPYELPSIVGKTIAVLGGTGEQGRGLATRWAAAGLKVILGSRDSQRAQTVAGELVEATGVSGDLVTGSSNEDAVIDSDIVVIAVPWAGHEALCVSIAPIAIDKIVVDCVNPLGFDKQGAFGLAVEQGSAAQQAAELLPESTVTAAFHHLSAVLLLDLSVKSLDTDVLVLGDNREATDVVQALAQELPGVRGVFAGRLRNAHQVEAMTANLISVNRRYKAHAGIRVTDI